MTQAATIADPQSASPLSSPSTAGDGRPAGVRIAYFTGHFPQTTHTFFWREIRALESIGCRVSIVSTRQPPLADNDWQQDAARRTHYLTPFGGRGLLESLRGFLLAGPHGIARVLAAWFRSEGDWRAKFKRLAMIPVAARLATWQRRDDWNHVHVGFAEHAADVAMLANRLTGMSYSISLGHSIHDSGPNQRLKWNHARFSAAISRFLADEVKEHFAGKLPCPLYVAPRGVDASKFERSGPYTPWVPGEPARLFSCARITPNKGFDAIIKAVARLKSEHGIDFELRIAGGDRSPDSRYTKSLMDLAESLGVGSRVQILGACPQPQVIEDLHLAHVVIIGASKTYKEGWGNAIGEAVASGTPTIACRTGGVPETITPPQNGLLAEPGDAESIAACLVQLLTDSRLALAISEAGPASIRARYSPTAGAEVLIQAIRDTADIGCQS